MLPAVPHVVAILEFAMRSELRHDGGDRDPSLVAIATGIPVGTGLLYPPIWRHQTVTHLEFMRVGVGPAHDPLKVLVQARQRPMVGDEHPTPDEGDHLQQFDSQWHRFVARRFRHSSSLRSNCTTVALSRGAMKPVQACRARFGRCRPWTRCVTRAAGCLSCTWSRTWS